MKISGFSFYVVVILAHIGIAVSGREVETWIQKDWSFLKQCRKEKNLTQEQLAEKFEVSARTVSRWETGINMPDLSILVQLAEYYDVEMRELLDGERSQTMNKEMKRNTGQSGGV